MTTPTTIEFSFKWASTETERGTESTTINYTSTTSIPIWRYNNLQKIVVKTRSIKNSFIDFDINNLNLNFILFDKTRDSNPALTDNNPFNLHDELLKFEKVLYTKIPLYGQPYNHMYYVNMEAAVNNYKTSFYRMGMDRTFNVTYTYNYFEYVTPKSIGLPLQFLFNDFILTASDATKYKAMGYTVDDLIKAGLNYTQLILCGYNIIDDLFPELCKPSGIDVECIKAINSLKTTNNTLKVANDLLQATNNTLHSTNTTLTTTNNTLKVTNDLLKTTNNTLHSTNTALRTLQTRVPLHDSMPDDKDYYISQED